MTYKKKVQVWVDLVSYLLLGLGGFTFFTNHADFAYGITLVAGAINKFVPRLFGIEPTV